MTMRSKLLLLVGLALSGLLLLSVLGLHSLRTSMLDDRMQKMRSLVETALTTVTYYEGEAAAGRLEREDAEHLARQVVSKMRYDGKDYFFIVDQDMKFVAHGANARLVGQSANTVKTPDGHLFGDLIRSAMQGNGELYYRWDKPGASEPVDKISYAKQSGDWKWVVLTGAYVDDIEGAFWQAAYVQLALIAILVVVLIVSSLMIVRGLLKGLGGEPAYAVQIVRQIASGQLGTQVRLAPGDNSSLLAAIADMQGNLRELIAGIIRSANELGQMAGRIEEHAEVNASHSEQQSQAAAAMAAAIEQLTTSIQHIADHANVARDQSQASGEISRQSADVIHRTVNEIEQISSEVGVASESIRQLADKTESIKTIMTVIRDVAEQTNLLALNAAIEAARAGEMVRGFAVVADEVRKLAERTTSATQEIAAMIGAIQTTSDVSRNTIADAVGRAKSGVALAAEGGAAITRIQDSAGEVVSVVNDISHSLSEQSLASNDIAQHVERIAQGAAANAGVAHETAAATVELHKLTHSLRESVSRFTV